MTRPPGDRRAARRRRDAVRALPELIDLVVVATHAGQTPLHTLRGLTAVVPPVVRPTVERVVVRVDAGERLTDALQTLVDDLGPAALALVDVLRAQVRDGGAMGAALDRLADDARRQRRQRAELAARELPVRLAFPLVCCTLPSFVLVAIVPLLLGAISSLRQP